MKLGKWVLIYYAVLFIAFGGAGLVAPDTITGLIQYILSSPVAKMEFMATYGGLFLGIGIFMLYCVGNDIKLGLVSVLFTMGAMLVTRLVGYYTFGEANILQYVYLAGELFTVLLVGAILYMNRNKGQA